MTARYFGDCCPACGSDDILPYAVLVGGGEEYGYQCLVCEVMWPVLTYPARTAADPAGRERSPAA
jgi:hypothetical protein